MRISFTRRQFLGQSVLLIGAGMAFPALRTYGGATNAPAAAPPEIAPPGRLKVQWHGRFSELPPGSVTPLGWIQGWLRRQADGLTGHPENMAYPYDTCMYAGKIPPPSVPHGEDWWPYEQSGYFVDGAARLCHLIDAPGAKKVPDADIKYILEHSGPGKLGESVWGWPNAVIGRALLAEYAATGDRAVADVLARCVLGSRVGSARSGYVFEEALYLYALSGDSRLLDLARRAYDRYFTADPGSFSHEDRIRGGEPLREHGVTAAEQLKLLPLMYCYTGDPEALELANLAYRKVERDSLMPDGGITSEEGLETTAFNSVHETCDITDWSWSFGYLLMAGGEAHWADRIEQMIFNALPGAVTKDFQQVQYFSSANQILASSTACPLYTPTRMSYRAAHETECCAGNVNRAMPNYVIRMWMGMEGGLAATLFGPSRVQTEINGRPVTITEETDYPFRETIAFKVNVPAPAAFALGLRIPEWCEGAAVTLNGQASGVECRPGTFAIVKREYRDGDVVGLQLPMKVQLREWFNRGAVSVERGPLVYTLPVAEKRVESRHDPEAIRRVLNGNNIQGFPAVEFFPAGEWRYGMDAAQKDAPEQFTVITSPMPENPYLAKDAPVRIEAPLRALPQWAAGLTALIEPPPADIKLMPKNPAALPAPAEFASAGNTETLTLVPYGATHLRLTTLPVIGRTNYTSPS